MTTLNDTFNRADSSAGFGTSSDGWSWSMPYGATTYGISSNNGVYVSGAGFESRADSDLAGDAHYAQFKVISINTALDYVGLCTRMNGATTRSMYQARYVPLNGFRVYLVNSGTFTLKASGGSTLNANDVLKLESTAADVHTLYRNGSVEATGFTDSTITGNTRCGVMIISGGGGPRIDDFQAADLAATSKLFLPPTMTGLGAGGPFFANPVG